MKVALLSTWETRCGVAGYTRGLRDGLDRRGTETQVVVIDRPATNSLTRPELEAHFIGLVDQLARADIVHIQHEFGFFSGSFNRAVSIRVLRAVLARLRRASKPVMITLHTHPFAGLTSQHPARMAYYQHLKMSWRRRIVPFFRGTLPAMAIVPNPTSLRAAIDSGVAADRVRIVRMGVDWETRPTRSVTGRQRRREALGFAADDVVLLMFGFVARHKGYDTTLAALRQLPDHFKLAIVGEPHHLGETAALDEITDILAKDSKLASRVRMCGWLPSAKARAYFDASDLFLAPYHSRPAPSSSAAVTWGLAAGRPVIASSIPAFAELNREASCIELVPPHAPRELAATVERLMADSDRRRRLVLEAERYCEANSWDASADQHLRLYRELAEDTPRPAVLASPSSYPAVLD